jgi:hypothetical protein
METKTVLGTGAEVEGVEGGGIELALFERLTVSSMG